MLNKKDQHLVVEVVAGRKLVAMDEEGTSDPYVVVTVGREKFKTKVIHTTLDPVWDIGSMSEKFTFKKAWSGEKNLVFKCMDWDRFKADDRMGMVTFPIKQLEDSKDIDDWFPLKPQKPGDVATGELHLRIYIRGHDQEVTQYSVLWKAVKKGDLDLVIQELLTSPDLNEKDPTTQESLLHLAVTGSNAQVVDQLIEAGCSVTCVDANGNTPLHAFCRHFAYPSDILRKFVEKGAFVDAQNKFGETPLHYVVFNPSIKLLMAEQLLLNENANPNIPAENKDTPLHYAIQVGRIDLVKLFIAHNADCGIVGSKGVIPLTLAKQLGFDSVQSIIRDCLDLRKHLKQAGMDKYLYGFILEEVFLYHFIDLSETSLEKLVKDPTDRATILASTKGIKILNRQETFLRKQEHFKKREELRKKESRVRNLLQESLKDAPAEVNEWEIDISDVEFFQLLGHGTSGSVYKGFYKGSTLVAIKVLKTVGDNWTKEVNEFITEFSIALKVQSPHIVQFFGATTKNKLCMVMEFCEKGSLYNLLQDENVYIDWDIAFKMLEEICLGILALHNHTPSILHRDLKTLNVLVTSDLRCKLCDFGLSRFDTASSAQTLIKCRGTYAYIAPEVYHQKGYFKQSDVYSIAIMIWEFTNRIITGEYIRPYQDVKLEFQILMQAHMKGKRPEIPAATPPLLRTLITESWDENHLTRPNSEQLLVRLENLRSECKLNQAVWDSLLKNKASPDRPALSKKDKRLNLSPPVKEDK